MNESCEARNTGLPCEKAERRRSPPSALNHVHSVEATTQSLVQRPAKSSSPIWLTGLNIPITFENCKHKALSDSQASENLVTRTFAEEHGFDIRQKFQAFRMIDGTTQLSTGSAWVPCGIDNRSETFLNRLFYVFERLHVPLLIGRSFWEGPRIRSSLDCCNVHIGVEYPCVPLRFQRDGHFSKSILSLVDTGTKSNLMSLRFAQKERFSIKPRGWQQIRTPNGRLIPVVGTIKAKVQLGTLKGPTIDCRFLVVPNLTYDIGLGQRFTFNANNKSTILSCLIYANHSGEFVLYAANNHISNFGTRFVNIRSKYKDPGDDKEIEKGSEELEEATSRLKKKQQEVLGIWIQIDAIASPKQMMELLREWEREVKNESKGTKDEKREISFFRKLVPSSSNTQEKRLRGLKNKWKKAKREESFLVLEVSKTRAHRNRRLKEVNAGHWEESSVREGETEVRENDFSDYKKVLADRERSKRELIGKPGGHIYTPRSNMSRISV